MNGVSTGAEMEAANRAQKHELLITVADLVTVGSEGSACQLGDQYSGPVWLSFLRRQPAHGDKLIAEGYFQPGRSGSSS